MFCCFSLSQRGAPLLLRSRSRWALLTALPAGSRLRLRCRLRRQQRHMTARVRRRGATRTAPAGAAASRARRSRARRCCAARARSFTAAAHRRRTAVLGRVDSRPSNIAFGSIVMPSCFSNFSRMRLLLRRHDRDGRALTAHPTSPTYAVEVIFRVGRRIQVEDVGHAFNIKSSCGNVRCQ